jgi:serine/threonine protein kinase
MLDSGVPLVVQVVKNLHATPTTNVDIVQPVSSNDDTLPPRFVVKAPVSELEQRLTIRAQGPGVVPLLFTGKTASACCAIATRLYANDLHTICSKKTVPCLEIRLTWAASLVSTLRSLHSAGIIHRDIKPANILHGDDEHVVICDFDCATILDDESKYRSDFLCFRGTRMFASASALQGHAASFRDDFESLCYTMLWVSGVRWKSTSDRPLLTSVKDEAVNLVREAMQTCPGNYNSAEEIEAAFEP